MEAKRLLTPSILGSHFYLEICARLDNFVNIRKGLWRSEV
ncbi:hypothetical protein E2C01_101453 [Portunus trituberculatus]|uniref:Uncharacterized protein n=1 Tax=Portunus trituberculatus TaxID=210409 RepID=A0A5B7KM08_PORTR|nr:hypothetical protein [Portunus trituberculatus]